MTFLRKFDSPALWKQIGAYKRAKGTMYDVRNSLHASVVCVAPPTETVCSSRRLPIDRQRFTKVKRSEWRAVRVPLIGDPWFFKDTSLPWYQGHLLRSTKSCSFFLHIYPFVFCFRVVRTIELAIERTISPRLCHRGPRGTGRPKSP